LSVNKYAKQCDDGREDALLAYVLARPDLEELRGNPLKVAAAIDEYSFKTEFLISVGPRTLIPFPRYIPLLLLKGKFCDDRVPNSKNIDKANILTNLILKEKPKTIVELGGYTGYSAIVFGAAMREAHGSDEGLHVFSLEMNPGHAEIARKLSASPSPTPSSDLRSLPKHKLNPSQSPSLL